MRIKREILLIIAIIFVAMIGGVSAAEDNQTSDVVSVADDSPTVDTKTNDTVGVTAVDDGSSIEEEDSVIEEETTAETKDDKSAVLAASSNDDVLGVPADQEVLGATLGDLQTLINANGNTKTLTQNYVVGTNTADYQRVTINKNLVINGNGHRIDANGRGTIFYITGTRTITFNNLIIANAGTGQNEGGAIYCNEACTITFNNCQFINNNRNGNGGVLCLNRGGTYTFSNCVFNGNHASGSGGVIYAPGYYTNYYYYEINTVFSFTDCKFDGNTADGDGSVLYSTAVGFTDGTAYMGESCTFTRCDLTNNAAVGDATLHISYHTMSITGCNFENNTGYADGGAIHAYRTTNQLTVSNSNFINNKATSTEEGNEGRGGALRVSFAPRGVNINNCLFEGNSAMYGGAYYTPANEMPTTVTNSRFRGNIAVSNGGAVYCNANSSTFTGSEFTGNEANNGAGIFLAYAVANIKITDCNFTNNEAVNEGAAIMGIYNENNIQVDRSRFNRNTALNGGAIALGQNSNDFSLTNSKFNGNHASGYGGCVYFESTGDNVYIYNTDFIDNFASSGGAIHLFSSRMDDSYNGVDIIDCKFHDNNCTSPDARYGGSAIGLNWANDVTIRGCTFDLNHASSNGAVMVDYCYDVNVDNCNFTNNYAGRFGGAFYAYHAVGDADVTFTKCTFDNNTAARTGGAIATTLFSVNYENLGNVYKNWQITDCDFTNNKAELSAGALYLPWTTGLVINNIPFDNNTAGSYGAMYWSGDSLDIHDVNFTNNDAKDGDCGALYIGVGTGTAGAHTVINNVLFENNTAYSNGGALAGTASNVNITNDKFKNNSAWYGGAIYWNGGANVNIDKNEFIANSANSAGAVDIYGTKNTNIHNSVFVNNTATNQAGAVWFNSEGGSIYSCEFTNNKAGTNAGAIILDSTSQTIRDCKFDKNVAGEKGGAVYDTGSGADNSIFIRDSTFTENKAYDGAGVYITDGRVTQIYNDTFIDNIASHNGGGAYVIVDAIAYVDYDLFKHTGIYEESTERINWNVGSRNVIYSSLFENNNIDYYMNVSAVVSGLTAVITVTVPVDANKSRNGKVVFDITYTNQTGSYKTQYVLDNFDDNPGTITLNLPSSEVGHYDVIVQFSEQTYLMKQFNVSYNVTDPRGDFEILQGLINDAIANHFAELDLTRSYTFTPGNETNPLDFNVYDIEINAPLIINGHGWTINALGYCRIFAVNGANVVLNDLKIINGNNATDGGAIYWAGSNGTVRHTEFINNTATHDGGAIYFAPTAADSQVLNCTFEDNTAGNDGGAIDWNATRGVLNDSTFINNTAGDYGGALCREVNADGGYGNNNVFINNTAGEVGGAIAWMKSESITINNYDFINNTAGYSGGAIYVGEGSGNCVVKNSYFEANEVTGEPGHGGAIEWYSKEGTIDNSEFVNNKAYKGGAVFVGQVAGDINITNSVFTNNTALTHGGAIDANASSVIMKNSEFYNNTAEYGGALYVGGAGEHNSVGYCLFIGNNATENGGAIDWAASNGNVLESTFEYNHAKNGGAVYVGGLAEEGSVINSTFNHNSAEERGGAVCWNATIGKLTGSTFFNNSAQLGGATYRGANSTGGFGYDNTYISNKAELDGGAIYWNGAGGNITYSEFHNNTAGRNGGAVYVGAVGATAYITDALFVNNDAGNNGGAVDWAASNGHILRSTFEYNDAVNGGAVFIGGLAEGGSVINSTFNHNTAKENGGAVDWNATIGRLTGSTFFNNSATYGGATYRGANSSGGYGYDNIYIDNHAEVDGGAIYWNGAGGNITYSEFYNNTANRNGGAVYVGAVGTTSYITDAIFVNNSADNRGGAVDWAASNGNVLRSTFEYNSADYGGAVFIGGTSGNGKIINSTFNHNHADENGGALDWNSTIGQLINSTFYNNTAKYGGATYRGATSTGGYGYNNVYISNHAEINGGAIDWNAAGGNVTHSEFRDNTAGNDGGAIYVGAQGATTYITDATFDNNDAGNNGGAVNWAASNGHILNSRFDYNDAVNNGGAVFIGGSSGNGTIINSTFNYNHAGENGGAIDWNSTVGKLTGSNFTFNSAKYGGATFRGANATGGYGAYNIYISNYAEINGGAIDWNATGGNITHSEFYNNTAGENGGALFVGAHGATAYITDAIFENNKAGNRGGAIDIYASNTHIIGTNFTSNAADYGGAVFAGQNANISDITNSIFVSNSATYNGGAVDWNASSGRIIDSTFDKNTAEYGGAVFVGATTENGYIIGSTFTNNIADLRGGAVDWNASNGHVNNSKFEGNEAHDGGAIFVGSGAAMGHVYNSTFIANRADSETGKGGAILFHTVDQIYVGESNFTSNSADHAGAIYIDECDGATLETSQFTSNSANNDGAVHWEGNNGTLRDSIFTSNTAVEDAGALGWKGVDSDIYNVTFDKNSAGGKGGAIYWVNVTDDEIHNVTFTSNQAFDGGAIYWLSGNGHLYDATFTSNVAFEEGGALYLDGLSNNTLTNATFTSNKATGYFNPEGIEYGDGGAIYITNSDHMNLTDLTFDKNSAALTGGAICLNNTDDSVLTGLEFTNNRANTVGGTIYWNSSSNATINDVSIVGSTAHDEGGAIYLIDMEATVEDVEIDQSTATYASGGAIYANGNVTINNATLTNFKSLNDVAAAILFDGGNSSISNSTLTGNNAIVINEGTTVHVTQNTITDGNPDDGYAVLNGGTLYLQENDFVDVIINSGEIKTQTYTIVLGNQTVNVTAGTNVQLNATIVDDTKNNDIVEVDSFQFHDLTAGNYISSTYSGRANYGTYQNVQQGKYIISASDVGLTNNTILTGTLIVKASNTLKFNITQINEGENVTIKVQLLPPDNNFPYEGNISLTVDGNPYVVEIVDGIGTLKLYNLSAKTYRVTATYDGDTFHNNATNETYFIVNLRETQIKVIVDNILYGQNATAIATTNANGTVQFILNGRKIAEIVNGNATWNISGLEPGKYQITVIYPGNEYFAMNFNETTFEVYKNNAVIDSIEFERVVPVGTPNTITVTMGNVTSGVLTIEVNGVNYTATITNKVAKLNVTLPVGKDYEVKAYFLGDNHFNATNKAADYTFEVTDKNVTVINITSLSIVEVDGRLVINFTTNTTAPLNVTVNGNPVTLDGNSFIADTSAIGTYMVIVTSEETNTHAAGYNSTIFTVIKHNATVNITVDPIHFVGDDFTITVTNNTAAVVTINGKSYNVKADGTIDIDTTQLEAGEYIVSAVIAENDKYYGNSTEVTFRVVKYNATIDSVNVTPTVEIGQNITIEVTMGNVTSGNLLIEVYGWNYTVPIVDGVAKLNVTTTIIGNGFPVTAYFLGDNKYNATSKVGNTFNVTGKYPTVITIEVESVVEIDGRLVVNLTTNTTAPLIVEVNGQPVSLDNYSFVADTSVAGTYTITARSDEGQYYYAGYNSTTFTVIKHNSTVNVTVGPIHFVEDVFTINVTNNTSVVVTINGKTYEVKADGTVDIDTTTLEANEYIVNAVIAENDKYYGNSSSATFKVVRYNAEIISVAAEPLVVPVGQSTQITVTMGNVTTGEITIEVNGVNSTAAIVDGVAKLNVTLPIGKYANVTAYFLGDYKHNATNKTGNAFEVTDKNITVIEIESVSVIEVDGKLVINITKNTTADLIVTVNGNAVDVDENNSFVADTSAAGTYTIIVRANENEYYSNGYNSTVYTVIKHNSTVDIAVDPLHYVNDTFAITITNNTAVNVTINGKTYAVKANGTVDIDTTKLEAGEYVVIATISESDKYYGNTTTKTFNVVKYNAEIQSVVATPIVAEGQNTTITVTMANVTSGVITIEVNGVNYTANIVDSVAKLNVSLPVGKDYPVKAYFLGDYKYNATSMAGNSFEVTDKNVTVIEIESISVVEIDSKLIINVTTNTNATLVVTVNGKTVTLNSTKQFIADTSAAGVYTIVATAPENNYYSSGYNSTTYTVVKHNSTVNVTVDPIHYVGDDFTIKVTNNTSAVLTINGKTYTIKADGTVDIDTTTLEAGEYIVSAVVTESDKYYGNSSTATFKIVKYNAIIDSVVAEPLVAPVGQNTTITVTMANVTSGVITIEVGGVNYTVDIVDSVAKLNVSLPVGKYANVTAYFLGDYKYNATNKTGNAFEVTDKNITVINIDVANVTVVGSKLIVTIDTNTTAQLNVTVNGKSVTLNETKQFIADTSVAGTYTIVATAAENEFYSNGFNSTTFTVIKHNSTVDIAVDAVHYVNDTFTINVTSNSTANVTINGKSYAVKADGTVDIDTSKLEAGEYIVSAVVSENDKYYGNSTTATFKIVKYNAEIASVVATPVVAEGQNTTITVTMANVTSGTITIDVNGVNYTATINNKIAVLNVSLPVGKDYPVTAYFLGDYKYNATSKAGNPFEVTDKNVTIITIDVESVVVVDDKVIVTVATNTTAPLNVTVNGKQVTLNSTGQFVADTSVAGTYNIVARALENEFYSNGFNSTTFTVIKHNSTVDIAVDPIHFVGDDFTITVTNNTTVNVTINGKTYAVGTDGKVSIDTTALEAGEYTVTATVYENDKYYGNATTATFKIVKYNATIDSVVVTPTTEIGQNITITVTMGNVTDGTVLIEIYGNNYTVPIVNSVATLNVTATKIGNDFPVTAYFLGDNKHNATSKAGNTFNVTGKYTTVINIDVESVVVVDDKVIVTVTTNTTANLVVEVNGESVTLNSTGQFIANTSVAGTYTITAQTEESDLYYGAFNSTTFTVIKHNSTVEISVDPLHYVNDTFAIVVTSNTTVNVTINGKSYELDADGKVIINTAELEANEYIINAVVTESAKYYGNSSTATFKVVKYNAVITSVVAEPIVVPEGQNTTITVTMANVTSGVITIEVDNKNYTAPIVDGVAKLNVTLPVGKYGNVSAYFLGDYKYNATNMTGNAFEVTDKNVTVITIDVESVVVVDNVVIVTITTNTTAPLNVTVNGKSVTLNETKQFVADTSVAGTYTIVATAAENEFYSNGFNSTTFTVIKHNSTVEISVDPLHYVDDTFTITVTSNTTVNVTINGKSYAVKADGTVDIDTSKLEAGEYIVSAIVTENDKYYGNSTNATFKVVKYNAEITSVVAEPIVVPDGQNTTITVTMANVTSGVITIEVNGVNYTANIVNSIAKLNVSLPVGKYGNVSAYFLGDYKYNATNMTGNAFEVTDKNVTVITIDVESVVVVDSQLIVTLATNTTAPLNVTVNGKSVTLNETKQFVADTSVAGTYTIVATAAENEFYSNGFNSTTFEVIKYNSTVDISVDPLHYVGDDFTIIVTSNTTVSVTINGKSYAIDADGKVIIDTTALEANEYIVTAVVTESAKYYGNSTNATFRVVKLASKVNVTAENIVYGNESVITVKVPTQQTGYVTITVNNKNYTSEIKSGEATFTVPNLNVGDYTVDVTYLGDGSYNASTNSTTFKVTPANLTATVEAKNITVVENSTFIINNVNPDFKGNVSITVDGVTYDGSVKSLIEMDKLTAGNKTATVKFYGDDNYNDLTLDVNFTVSKLDTNMKVIDNNDGTVVVVVPDDTTGNITITVEGKNFTAPIENGTATITLDGVNSGKHNITVSYPGDDKYNDAEVNTTIDIKKFDTPINVTVKNIKVGDVETIVVSLPGNATGNVTIYLDGKSYTEAVSNGNATFTISDLTAGNKTVAVTYSGDKEHLSNSTSANFEVSKRASWINVDVEASYVGTQVNITVEIPANATGSVVIEVDGVNYTVNTDGGKGTLTIPGVGNTTHTVKVTYLGDGQYLSSTNSTSYGLSKVPSTITVEVDHIYAGDVAVVNITVISGATGNVTIKIGSEYENTVGVTEGKFSVIVPGLTTGDKTVEVTYNGDEKYLPSSNSTTFEVLIKDAMILSNNVTAFYNQTNFTVRLVDSDNNPIAGQTIVFKVNNQTYTAVTDEYGDANVVFELPLGEYTVESSFTDAKGKTISANNTIIMSSSIIAKDIKRGWNSPYDYFATVLDGNGHVLANQDVTVIVNGKSYTVTTDKNGDFFLTDSKLAVGEYKVTIINNATGEVTVKTVTIVKRLIENKDITMDFVDGTCYVVRVIGDDGNPVGAGEFADIYANTIHYSCRTDKNGYVKLQINLNPRTYTLTAEYKGYKVSNKLVVKQTLKLVKKTVTVKKGKKLVLKAKVKWNLAKNSGKSVKGIKIVFKFKGKKYTAKTNAKGIAKVTIKSKITKKLKKGKKYTYSATYITNTVKGKVKVK